MSKIIPKVTFISSLWLVSGMALVGGCSRSTMSTFYGDHVAYHFNKELFSRALTGLLKTYKKDIGLIKDFSQIKEFGLRFGDAFLTCLGDITYREYANRLVGLVGPNAPYAITEDQFNEVLVGYANAYIKFLDCFDLHNRIDFLENSSDGIKNFRMVFENQAGQIGKRAMHHNSHFTALLFPELFEGLARQQCNCRSQNKAAHLAIAEKSKAIVLQGLSGFTLKNVGYANHSHVDEGNLKDWQNGQSITFNYSSGMFSHSIAVSKNKGNRININCMHGAKNFRDILIHLFTDCNPNTHSIALFSFHYDKAKANWYRNQHKDSLRNINESRKVYYNKPEVFELWYRASKDRNETNFIARLQELFKDGAIAGYTFEDFIETTFCKAIQRCIANIKALAFKLNESKYANEVEFLPIDKLSDIVQALKSNLWYISDFGMFNDTNRNAYDGSAQIIDHQMSSLKASIIAGLKYVQAQGLGCRSTSYFKAVLETIHALKALKREDNQCVFKQDSLDYLAAELNAIKHFTYRLNSNGVYLKDNLCNWLELIVGKWHDLFVLPLDTVSVYSTKYTKAKHMREMLCRHIEQMICHYSNMLKHKDNFDKEKFIDGDHFKDFIDPKHFEDFKYALQKLVKQYQYIY